MSSTVMEVNNLSSQRKKRPPLGVKVLAGFAAFGCTLSIAFILTGFLAIPPLKFQPLFAVYAILNFAIGFGYLRASSWGWKVGLAGAILDIFLPSSLLGALSVPTSFIGWSALLLVSIGIFTIIYLQRKNVTEWFKVQK